MKKKDYLIVKKYLKSKRRFLIKEYKNFKNNRQENLIKSYEILIEHLNGDIRCLNKAWKNKI